MWGAIIGAVVSIGTSIGSYFIAKKGDQKGDILQIMEEYVYGYGMSLEQLKTLFPTLYKKNTKYFDEQYKIYKSKYDEKQKDVTDWKENAKPIFILVIIALAAYYVTS